MKIGSIDLGVTPLLLAPMEDVTDSPFRQLCKKMGANMVYTEFISSDAVIRSVPKTMKKMAFTEYERPFGIQIFGGDEHVLGSATQYVANHKPDVIDINFGCPVYKIVNKGAGAACLKDLKLMYRMTQAVIDFADGIPVTVKTRLGWDDDSIYIQDVALMLQSLGVKLLTVHARTRCQKYNGNARWEWLKCLKETPNLSIPIIGNGDIKDIHTAHKMLMDTKVDGLMIGRAAIGYPWIFKHIRDYLDYGIMPTAPTIEERIDMCMQHLNNSVSYHGEHYGVLMMRKHYGTYLKNIHGGKKLRATIITMKESEAIYEQLQLFLQHHNEDCLVQ